MDLGLADATAAVAGGGRGMGLAAARCLADDGARVAGIARSRADLDRATEDLARRGSPDAVGLVADIGDANQVNDVLGELGQRWGDELNVLIKAVGPTVRGDFEALTDAQWWQAVDEGVMGMVHCVRSALPLLRKAAWARIVNFSAHSTQHFGHPADLPRAGLPNEVGPVVAFLASRRNSYMTGANVNVDGGSDFT
jgi:3-oxoacyl-[acyl-carrier protein] reductase